MHDHGKNEESCGCGAHGKTGSGHSAHGHGGFERMAGKGPFGMMGMHPHGMGGHGGMRARRGDVRTAILRLLSEAPMHGYQIIQELSARSGGAWSPSAGSVYPTLQMLADEGLVSSEESAGKKVFSLTEAGVAEVAKCADQPAPWEDAAQSDAGGTGFREAVAKLMPAVFQVGKNGTTAQATAAVEVLNDARKKLYDILAEH